jgi:hypothetical protein
LLSQKAHELGQLAHETSPESERGTLLHKAYELQSADGLSASEVPITRLFWRSAKRSPRSGFPMGSLSGGSPKKGFGYIVASDPVLSGQIDELLIQSDRALVLDVKTGRGEIDPPATNAQLRIYAMLARVRWPELESITVAVLSPHFSFSPHTFDAAELETIRDETLRTLATLDFQSAPRQASIAAIVLRV